MCDSETKGRLEDCEIWGNMCGVKIEGGHPALIRCTIRDHRRGAGLENGIGVFIWAGGDMDDLDCIFMRNAKGDCVVDSESGSEGDLGAVEYEDYHFGGPFLHRS